MNFRFKNSNFFEFPCSSSISFTARSAFWLDLGMSINDSSTDQCVFKHLIAFLHFVLVSEDNSSLKDASL